MCTTTSLIAQLEALDLIEIKFKRKPRSGVHAFFDPITDETFYTHTTGYIRRVNIVPYRWAQFGHKRYAPINNLHDVVRYGVDAYGKAYTYRVSQYTMIPTEFERLNYLLKFIQRRRERALKANKNS
jgi:hypothetical protein